MPYGFPSGAALTDQVVSSIGARSNEVFQNLIELGHAEDEIEAFRDALRYSGKTSVDAFLEHRSSFLDVGKAAIAANLIPYEQPGPLFGAADRWYQHVYSALNAQEDDFQNNRFSVVTFNYDRSLETFLFTCLQNTYGITDERAAELAESVPIVHVHGRLGRLPWQSGDGKERPYNKQRDSKTIAVARDSIRVIHEDAFADTILQQAQELINEADALVFVGFGYHGPNIRRLRIDLDKERAYVGGSRLGLTNLEAQTAAGSLPKRFDMGHQSLKALEFLRERVELV